MKAYADTGFLCSLYSPDAHTDLAIQLLKADLLPLPWTWLHQLELRNAMRLRLFRKEITPDQGKASLNLVEADLREGFFEAIEVPLEPLLREVELLSQTYSEELGTRSLDILHVAGARVMGIPLFISFDRRQCALASRAGLQLVQTA